MTIIYLCKYYVFEINNKYKINPILLRKKNNMYMRNKKYICYYCSVLFNSDKLNYQP